MKYSRAGLLSCATILVAGNPAKTKVVYVFLAVTGKEGVYAATLP